MPRLLSYGGPELFVAVVILVVTPLLYWLVLRRFKFGLILIVIGILWTGAVVAAYWDVYLISKEAERLCREEAGLRVYKTVEAEGFLGDSGIEYWSQYGFRYLEAEFIGGRKFRYTLLDGEVVKEPVEELWSRYEYATDSEVLEMPFTRDRKFIRDRQSDEVLGEIVSFAVYPGWIDSRMLGFLGFTWTPPRCVGDHPPTAGKSLSYVILLKAVVKAK